MKDEDAFLTVFMLIGPPPSMCDNTTPSMESYRRKYLQTREHLGMARNMYWAYVNWARRQVAEHGVDSKPTLGPH